MADSISISCKVQKVEREAGFKDSRLALEQLFPERTQSALQPRTREVKPLKEEA